MKKIIFFSIIIISTLSLAKTYTLKQCLEIGEKNNLNLKSNGYNIETTQLDVTSALNRFYDARVSASSGPSINESHNSERPSVFSKTNATYTGFSLSGNIDLGLIDNYRYSKLNSVNSDINFQNELKNLRYNITSSFFYCIIAQEDLKVKSEKIDFSKMQYEEAKLKYDLGSLTRSELLQAEVSLSQANLDIINSESEMNIRKQNLLHLLNLEESYHELKLSYQFTENDQFNEKPDELIQEALHNRLDLKMGRNNLIMSNLLLDIEENTYLPSLTIGVENSWQRVHNLNRKNIFMDVYSDTEVTTVKIKEPDYIDSHGLTARATLAWDLSLSDFNSIDKQKVEIKKSKLNLTIQEKNVINDTKLAYLEYLNQKENLKKIDKHIELAKENLELANEMFKLGNKTITEQIKAKNDYIDAKYQKINARYQYKTAIAKLMNSIGR